MKSRTRSSSKALWPPLILILIGLVGGALPAAAQQGPPPEAGPWGKERVETVIIGKFASELELTPEQAERFFPRFRQFQNSVDDIQRQRQDQRREMDDLAQDPGADQKRVSELLTHQSEQEQQVSGLKREFLMDVSSFLTPQQVSRCSILLDELPRRVHQFIEERRRGRMPGPPHSPQRSRGRGY